MTPLDLERWRRSPATFIAEVLRNPDTDQPFELTRAQRRYLRAAFLRTRNGRLRFPELVFGAPKKSGKTGFGAMVLLYVVLILGGRRAEGYCVANDLEQSTGRVFAAARAIVEASPMLLAEAEITSTKITFPALGSFIQALASDYAGAAGANPVITVFDELWAYTSERSHRLWDEMVPPPTRQTACRLTVTYAGFDGESGLLKRIYDKGTAGREIAPELYAAGGLLCAWHHGFTAPWQTEEWREQMREQLRPNAYLRLIENRWVGSEETFLPLDWWDAIVDPSLSPLLGDRQLFVFVGVDASTKRDSTAVVAVAWDGPRLRLVWHRIFQPSPRQPLDFEATIEETLLDLNKRFLVRAVRFDPWQMQAVAQRLTRAGLRMQEFPQTVPNLSAAAQGLYEAVKGRNLAVYPDADLRRSIGQTVAIEGSRGWRLAKEKQSHKIDVVVALAMAVRAAIEDGPRIFVDAPFFAVPLESDSLDLGYMPPLDWSSTRGKSPGRRMSLAFLHESAQRILSNVRLQTAR